MAKKETRPPVPVWRGADYARVTEGRYEAMAVRYQGPEWVRPYSRWSLLVEFELLDDGARICAFYNMGNDPAGPKITRREIISKHGRLRMVKCRGKGSARRKYSWKGRSSLWK